MAKFLPIKKIYRLHRILSALLGIPVLLWAISGLMHPLMTNFRPNIKTQETPVSVLQDSLLKTGPALKSVLEKNGIEKSDRIRLISIKDNWYYQVVMDDTNRYFSIQRGDELNQGDQRYSAYLAKHYLTGDQKSPSIKSITKVNRFNTAYSSVNRLLPVYRVSFDRADGINIYVSTSSSSFSFAIDNRRNGFNRFFGCFHTWSWMDQFPKLKAGIISIILLLTLLTGGLGIYLLIKTKAARPANAKSRLSKARRLHRITALVGAVFLFAWALSGLIHALQNGRAPDLIRRLSEEQLLTSLLPQNNQSLFEPLSDSGVYSGAQLFSIKKQLFLMTTAIDKAAHAGTKDLMKAKKVVGARHRYYVLSNQGAEEKTEKFTVAQMAAAVINKAVDSSMIRYIDHFSADYSFADKILPVWKVSAAKGSAPYFIDPTRVSVVKKPDSFKKLDAYSFAFFHKHEFMAWAGKSAKDTSTVIGILILITLLVFGYVLLIVKTFNSKQKN